MRKAHQRTPDGILIHDLRFLMHIPSSKKKPAADGRIATTGTDA
jgi:hypothetical protein